MEINNDQQSSEEEQQLEGEEEEEEEMEQERVGLESQVQEENSQIDQGEHHDDRPTKRPKTLVDQISELPDSVLTYILSLLPTRDAVKTSVLSKRWHHTWASTSSLIYHCDNYESLLGFQEFVDTTLILHKSYKVSKFVLRYKPRFGFFNRVRELRSRLSVSKVQVWVHAAVIKQAEEMSIKLDPPDGCEYLLPQSIYMCDSLTRLSLSYFRIAPHDSPVCWRLLKHLSITSAVLEDNLLQKLLSSCPNLETLKLKKCQGFDQIDINSERLKRLVISGYDSASDYGCVEINAPNLQFLEILGSMEQKKCRLKNVTSLFHATLTFDMESGFDYDTSDLQADFARVDDLKDMARDLMESVRHVQNLTIGTWITQAFSVRELHSLPSPIFSCKCLILKIDLCKFDLPGVANLLRCSCNLERLVVDFLLTPEDDQIFHFDVLAGLRSDDFWLSHKDMVSQTLKIVEIIGFAELMPEFVQFVLQYAKVLEKLIIKRENGCDGEHWYWYFGQENFFEVVQQLLSFPRSSTQAQIILL